MPYSVSHSASCPGAEELHSAGIKEKEELVYPDAEDLGEEEVSEFVDYDEYGQGQNHLKYLDEYNHNVGRV